ncbi:hypothetical protein AL520_09075 [Achromobacter xylosoxidans]|nr:hypothetical protein AL520_09075 [Achromobacter xylosoxidans]
MTTNTPSPAQEAAIQEGERIAAADEYFKARTWITDTNDNRRIFEAGFDRAYALLSKLRAPVADERAAFARSITGRDDLEPHQAQNVIDANGSRWATWRDRAALATVPLPNQSPIRLSAEVLEYLKEGIDSATQCEEADIDHDFANELGRLMQGPLFAAPLASAPVAGEAQIIGYVPPIYLELRRRGLPVNSKVQHSPVDDDTAPLYAAPQASAEDVRNVHTAALDVDMAEGIRSPSNACMHRNECRAMLDRQPKLPGGWQLALGLAIDAIENAPPTDWPVNWPAILRGLKDLRAALSATQPEQGERDAG